MANDKEIKAVTDVVDDETLYKTADVVTPEGGASKKRKADTNKVVDAKADTVKESSDEEMEDEDEDEKSDMAESFVALFEGADLTEEFKEKVQLVFEAAVNEAASEKTREITESLEAEFETKLNESVQEIEENMTTSISESMDEILENLDSYLDYIVSEWMEENEIAIESGVKVEMAESLMEGLMTLFSEHNLDVSEETIDVVSDLEGKLSESSDLQNALMSKNITLAEEVAALKSEKAFDEICEDLTDSQKERMRILSEKLDHNEIDSYKSDLSTLKESFFKKEAIVISEQVEDESEILTEETSTSRVSEYDSVNAIVAALNAKSKQ